jgi:signal transduction histidine kinase
LKPLQNLRDQQLLAPGLMLLTALALAGALALQALRAEGGQRRASERALRHHAAVAAWEFSRHARSHGEHTIERALAPVRRLGALEAGDSLPVPELMMAGGADPGCDCQVLAGVRMAFVLPADSSALRTAGEPPSATTRAWLASAVRAPPPAEGGVAVVFPATDGEPAMVAYQVIRRADGRAAATYGIVADAAVLAPVFARVVARMPLLPPVLTASLPNDSTLRVDVRLPSGETLYSSGDSDRTAFSASDTLGAGLGRLVVHAALRPRAQALLQGAMGAGRPQLLLSLFVLSGGLILMALFHLRRAAHLSTMRSRFVMGVSHELRTPLAQIRMFAETLTLGRARSDAERQQFLEILQREAIRLTDIVENVLQFSRLGQKKLLATEAVRLDRETEQALASQAPAAAARCVKLVSRVPAGLAATADAGAVRRILANLLDNALKYGPPGQTVTVSAEARGASVRLMVDDGGPGIPAGRRQEVFEPFARLDTSSTAPSGSGIGLTVVRELAGALGGRVWIEDAPAGGARFAVELPGMAATEAQR